MLFPKFLKCKKLTYIKKFSRLLRNENVANYSILVKPQNPKIVQKTAILK